MHQNGAGKDMEQLIEFYEMASLNKATLSAAEKRSLSQARLGIMGSQRPRNTLPWMDFAGSLYQFEEFQKNG